MAAALDGSVSSGEVQFQQTRKLCRSCLRCRVKKIKCTGERPQCNSCKTSGYPCGYLEDARRTGGTTKVDVPSLQREVAQLRGVVEQYRRRLGSPREKASTPLSEDPPRNHTFDFASAPMTFYGSNEPTTTVLPEPRIAPLQQEHLRPEFEQNDHSGDDPSPSEANIVGAFSEDGRLQVHGVTSTLHQGPRKTEGDYVNGLPAIGNESVSHRLISYAALQRQQEDFLFAGDVNNKIDLDGVPSETAKHLLDIHWNRQHFTYLLTYRPAVMESLRTGGPYVNKLLLNAIYYTSCQYSDRLSLRSDPNDPQTMGAGFYRRFKELLVDEIDKPSIPTAIALLLSGQCLVAYGKQAGGWVLCGTAYRMIIELGCHLSVDSRFPEVSADIVRTEVRRRLYWAAFVIDKVQSLYLGRPPALREVEARVSKELLDTYEEFASWTPYQDPLADSCDAAPSAQIPRPAYGVSSFRALLQLAEIAADVIDIFYSLESLKLGWEMALQKRAEIRKRLDHWQNDLPPHLYCNLEMSSSPPPHQLNPHLYWTLVILVGRPFMSNGHLSGIAEPGFPVTAERECATAALKIWGLVKAFKNTFTLRRGPYILCYAAYHAVLVLIHARETQVNFPDCVPYLWSALVDLKHGSHAGLTKPLQILRSKLPEDVFMTAPDGRETPGPQVLAVGGHSSLNLSENGPGMANADFLQSLDFDAWNTPFWLDKVVGSQLLQDDSIFGLAGPMPL